MAIQIKEILPSDSLASALEKVNYNFDQLILSGGGPAGPVGLQGTQGVPGVQGQRGSQWFTESSNGSTAGLTALSGVFEGDFWLASNGDVWEFGSTSWSYTGETLSGPTGPAGSGSGGSSIFEIYEGTGTEYRPDLGNTGHSSSGLSKDFITLNVVDHGGYNVDTLLLGSAIDVASGAGYTLGAADLPRLMILQTAGGQKNGISFGIGSTQSTGGSITDSIDSDNFAFIGLDNISYNSFKISSNNGGDDTSLELESSASKRILIGVNSNQSDTGTNIFIQTPNDITFQSTSADFNADVEIRNGKVLKLIGNPLTFPLSGNGYSSFQYNGTGQIIYQLPPTVSAPNKFLTGDASGNLSWTETGWIVNGSDVYPVNTTDEVAIGGLSTSTTVQKVNTDGTATENSKLLILGENSGQHALKSISVNDVGFGISSKGTLVHEINFLSMMGSSTTGTYKTGYQITDSGGNRAVELKFDRDGGTFGTPVVEKVVLDSFDNNTEIDAGTADVEIISANTTLNSTSNIILGPASQDAKVSVNYDNTTFLTQNVTSDGDANTDSQFFVYNDDGESIKSYSNITTGFGFNPTNRRSTFVHKANYASIKIGFAGFNVDAVGGYQITDNSGNRVGHFDYIKPNFGSSTTEQVRLRSDDILLRIDSGTASIVLDTENTVLAYGDLKVNADSTTDSYIMAGYRGSANEVLITNGNGTTDWVNVNTITPSGVWTTSAALNQVTLTGSAAEGVLIDKTQSASTADVKRSLHTIDRYNEGFATFPSGSLGDPGDEGRGIMVQDIITTTSGGGPFPITQTSNSRAISILPRAFGTEQYNGIVRINDALITWHYRGASTEVNIDDDALGSQGLVIAPTYKAQSDVGIRISIDEGVNVAGGLEVTGGLDVTGDVNLNAQSFTPTIQTAAAYKLYLKSNNAYSASSYQNIIGFTDSTSAVKGYVGFTPSSAGSVSSSTKFFVNNVAAGSYMVLGGLSNVTSGYYGPSTGTSPEWKTGFSGSVSVGAYFNGGVRTGGFFTKSSDKRLKENIVSVDGDDAIKIIEKLNPVSYNKKNSSDSQVGFIAQELKEHFPVSVYFDNEPDEDKGINDGTYSVEYNYISSLNVAATKELINENKSLKEKNKELEDRIKLIEEKLGL